MAAELATERDVERVHDAQYVQALHRFCLTGGGWLDADTAVLPQSWDAALRAAGAGLTAIDRLDAGEATAAFCAVRPPGHHATPPGPWASASSTTWRSRPRRWPTATSGC